MGWSVTKVMRGLGGRSLSQRWGMLLREASWDDPEGGIGVGVSGREAAIS